MNIPDSWGATLRSIRAECPSAVIAGGALRDLDNDREVKDIDVFVFANTDKEAFAAIEALKAAGLDVSYDETFDGRRAYPEDQNLEVIQIADMFAEDLEVPVQLIFVRWDTADIVNRFDYGICRLSWDGETLTRPPEYDADKAAKVFRLRRDRPTAISMRGSIRRYARLVADKYRDWDWWPFEAQDDFFGLFDAA